MRVEFNVCCVATYRGEFELPNKINTNDKEEILDYILKHLGKVPCENLEFLYYTDKPVTLEDIIYIGE